MTIAEQLRAEGKEQGLLVGLTKGKLEGKLEGEKEGRHTTQVRIARNLLSLGLPAEKVAIATLLSVEEVSELETEGFFA